MDAAWEQGIDHFDTADAYGGGRSERMIGSWMQTRGVRPTITTKTFNPMDAGADHGLAPERIVRQLESSLDRLGVDQRRPLPGPRVRPGRAARRTRSRAFEELARAAEDPRLRGEQLRRGAAGRRARGRRARRRSRTSTRCWRAATRRPCCRCASASGVAYLVFSPLAGGWLTGKYRRGEPFPAGSRMTQRPEPVRAVRVRRRRSIGSSAWPRSSRGATAARWRGSPWRGCWRTRA